MIWPTDDTIAAIASARGGALRGVLRMSGPDCGACLEKCFQPSGARAIGSLRSASRIPGVLQLAQPHVELPTDLYYWPDERSYTRQPSAELHTVGSPPLLNAGLETLCSRGARLARPGEFTLRAFLAGRLDLTQAEAVLGVIDAQDRRELDAALEQLAGGLAAPLNDCRDRLLDLLAHLEAGLDFVDEDIEFITIDDLLSQLQVAKELTRQVLARMTDREDSRREPRVVLRGWPNVGKSSLLNALSGAPEALVADVPGTTRDFIHCTLDVGGVTCQLIDTAGVEPGATDDVSAAAQQMTRRQQEIADLELFCIDATRPLNDWERKELRIDAAESRLVVATKADALSHKNGWLNDGTAMEAIATSARTGHGLADLKRAIAKQLTDGEPAGGMIAQTATRCRTSLQDASRELADAECLVRDSQGEELVAAQVRLALDHLGQVVGAIYTDDVLDRVFSRFCIGK